MDAKYINPILTSVTNVLGQFGVTGISKKSLKIKDEMVIDKDITAFVGMVGDIRGNVSYCFSQETAKKVVSSMMMGMPVNEIDDMARNGLSELSNMFTGNAATAFSEYNFSVDVTPPTVVAGEDMFLVLTFNQTISLELSTSVGDIEVNIGLEV